jgi:hypothetical protein
VNESTLSHIDDAPNDGALADHLFVLFRAEAPREPSSRHRLDGVDEVVVGRGAEHESARRGRTLELRFADRWIPARASTEICDSSDLETGLTALSVCLPRGRRLRVDSEAAAVAPAAARALVVRVHRNHRDQAVRAGRREIDAAALRLFRGGLRLLDAIFHDPRVAEPERASKKTRDSG